MAFISVTRLRIRSVRYLPGFMLEAVRARQQATRAKGFLGGALLQDRAWAFWTLTMWNSEECMRAYMLGGSHRAAMPKLLNWCDEASVVHWTQNGETLPSWEEADRRMRQEGRPSKVRNPSPHHASLAYRAPRTFVAGPIQPVKPR